MSVTKLARVALREVAIINSSGESMPARAIGRITGVDADGLLTIAKPNADSMAPGVLVILGRDALANGAVGMAALATTGSVWTSTGSSPGVGDALGTTSGSWTVSTGKTGFVANGSATGRARLSPDYTAGGGPGSTHNFLSATHPDTEVAASSKGLMVYGNADSPSKWEALAVPSGGEVLHFDDDTEIPAWSTKFVISNVAEAIYVDYDLVMSAGEHIATLGVGTSGIGTEANTFGTIWGREYRAWKNSHCLTRQYTYSDTPNTFSGNYHYKARGTHAAPKKLVSGDRMWLDLIYGKWDDGVNNNYHQVVGDDCYARENFDATHGGTIRNFYNCSLGDIVASKYMTFDGDGETIDFIKEAHAFDHVSILGKHEVRWYNTGNANYEGFKASDDLITDLIWTLMEDDGTAGQVIGTDGSLGLEFVDKGSEAIVNVYPNGYQDVTSSEASFEFDSETIDTGGDFNTTTHKFTAPKAGKYKVSTFTTITIDPSDTNPVHVTLYVYVNSTFERICNISSIGAEQQHWPMSIDVIVDLSASDTVDVRIKYGASSTPTSVTTSINGSGLNIHGPI